MQQFRNERAPLSVGEIVVVAVNGIMVLVCTFTLVLGLLTLGTSPWALVAGSLILGGAALAAIGALFSAGCLLARRQSAARAFQAIAAVGGLLFGVQIYLNLTKWSPPNWTSGLILGPVVVVLIGLAVYVRAITRRGAA